MLSKGHIAPSSSSRRILPKGDWDRRFQMRPKWCSRPPSPGAYLACRVHSNLDSVSYETPPNGSDRRYATIIFANPVAWRGNPGDHSAVRGRPGRPERGKASDKCEL